MPPKSRCRLPLTSVGRPAISGMSRSATRSSSGRTLLLGRLDQEQPLELVELLGMLRRDVLELGPVDAGVVELPDVVVERGRLLADEQPRRLVPRHRGPALVVDAAVAEHLEVLRLVALVGRRRRRTRSACSRPGSASAGRR